MMAELELGLIPSPGSFEKKNEGKRRRLTKKSKRARALCGVMKLRFEPRAFLLFVHGATELPHLTRRLLVARATRTNVEADSSSVGVPHLGKSWADFEKGFCIYDRTPSPQRRRQVNGNCYQGVYAATYMAI